MNEKKHILARLFEGNSKKGLKTAFSATETKASKNRRLTDEITKRPNDRILMEMGTLRLALESAKDTFNPNRYDLMRMYDNAITDSEVRSQSRTAINKMVAEPFIISRNGVDDPALTEYLHRPWFEKLLKFVFWSEMYGYTLVEFGRMDTTREFKDCSVFPRAYIRPDRKEVLTDPFLQSGIPVGDLMKPLGLVEIGDPSDLGTLETITREVIWKNFSRSDWATYSEKFGNPLITMTTDAEGDDLRKRILMLQNFASSGWAIGDKDSDTIELKEPASRGGAHLLFSENILVADKAIGKMINGQTGTSNNEAWAGTAGVHERIMDDYHDSRLRVTTNLVNYELIPFLVYWGYPLDGATFRFTALDPKDEIEALPDPDKPVAREKSLKRIVAGRRMMAADRIDKMLEAYLRRIYNGQSDIDPEIWRHNFNSLVQAVTDAGLTFNSKHKLYDLASELRTNAGMFAAFKNHREMEDLANLLLDNENVLRPFSEFKKLAKPITQNYNIHWLETEYTNAVSSAQMAKKWAGFEENKANFPNLEYRAVVDSQSRPEHARLDGLVLPMNDRRWNRIYPPNGHNCRCSVTQTSRPVRELEEASNFIPDPGFDGNPGIDKKLFSDTNEYQSVYKTDEQIRIEKEARNLMENA